MVKMSTISAGDHFIYVYFVRLRLLCCNARCQKTMKETSDGGATIWIQTLESSSIGLTVKLDVLKTSKDEGEK